MQCSTGASGGTTAAEFSLSRTALRYAPTAPLASLVRPNHQHDIPAAHLSVSICNLPLLTLHGIVTPFSGRAMGLRQIQLSHEGHPQQAQHSHWRVRASSHLLPKTRGGPSNCLGPGVSVFTGRSVTAELPGQFFSQLQFVSRPCTHRPPREFLRENEWFQRAIVA